MFVCLIVLLPAHLSICMKKVSSPWKNFDDSFKLGVLLKSVKEIIKIIQKYWVLFRPRLIFWGYLVPSPTPLLKAHWDSHESEAVTILFISLIVVHDQNKTWWYSYNLRVWTDICYEDEIPERASNGMSMLYILFLPCLIRHMLHNKLE
jgi:hypothetical protein